MLIAEFAPQSGVILTWPHAGSDWRDRLDTIEPVYVELARAVAAHERLLIICYDDTHCEHVDRQLAATGIPADRFHLVTIQTNDTWVRDYGPLVTTSASGTCLLDYRFDGWGGTYRADLDTQVTARLQDLGMLATDEAKHLARVLEGGSIDTDGNGTVLATSACLLSARHPELTRDALDRQLCDELGIARVLWLDHGEILGDDTDGHIDMLARFCSPDTIACSSCKDPGDPHFAPLRAMQHQLAGFRTTDGDRYRLVELPLPAALHGADNRRLPASYANFLIINGAVLMPAYNDPADAIAQQRLASCFPGRDIVPVQCEPLIHQGGSLHCATLQLPAGVLE